MKDRVLAWRPAWPVLLWAVACAAAYTTLSVRRYDRFELASYDNAIFQQAVRGYAHLGWPIVDVKGPGYNILGDHRISPTFDVYLLKRGTAVYALQVTGYYDSTNKSRQVSFRYKQIAQ